MSLLPVAGINTTGALAGGGPFGPPSRERCGCAPGRDAGAAHTGRQCRQNLPYRRQQWHCSGPSPRAPDAWADRCAGPTCGGVCRKCVRVRFCCGGLLRGARHARLMHAPAAAVAIAASGTRWQRRDAVEVAAALSQLARDAPWRYLPLWAAQPAAPRGPPLPRPCAAGGPCSGRPCGRCIRTRCRRCSICSWRELRFRGRRAAAWRRCSQPGCRP
mmetsp:Transcript_41949/g.125559  ORF Transcript_41949/g.125559 Transcript_41949/m.125559 type:complete len:216 (+) Transcript_41949:721-1368(+)